MNREALIALKAKVLDRVQNSERVEHAMRDELHYLFGPAQAGVIIGIASCIIEQDRDLAAILSALIAMETDREEPREEPKEGN